METEQVLEPQEQLGPSGEGEAPVEVEEEEFLEEATPPAGEEPPAEQEPKKKSRVQARIDELVREREEAREEAANWRSETQKILRAQQAPEPVKIEVDMGDFPVPRRENFEDEDEYQAALSERAAVKAYRTERARDQQRSAVQQQQEEFAKINEWQSAGKTLYPDFEVALRHPSAGGPLVTTDMAQVIMTNEKGHEVAYYLGKNPQESYRIANLHPVEQRIEILNLAKRVARTKVKTETSAPSPTSPVGDREIVAKSVDIFDPKISFRDYERIRMEQIKRRVQGP